MLACSVSLPHSLAAASAPSLATAAADAAPAAASPRCSPSLSLSQSSVDSLVRPLLHHLRLRSVFLSLSLSRLSPADLLPRVDDVRRGRAREERVGKGSGETTSCFSLSSLAASSLVFAPSRFRSWKERALLPPVLAAPAAPAAAVAADAGAGVFSLFSRATREVHLCVASPLRLASLAFPFLLPCNSHSDAF